MKTTIKQYLPAKGSRPICENKGCVSEAQFMGSYRKDGSAVFRRTCGSCHSKAVGAKHGLSSMTQVVAKNAGMTVKEYQRKCIEAVAAAAGLTVKEYRRKLLEAAAATAGLSVKEYQRKLLEDAASAAGLSVTQYRKKLLLTSAKKAGFTSITAYVNSKHKYRKHRGTSCANVDGRLGFVCTSTITDECMLDVDHINNKHHDNDPRNLHSLCKCCHSYKTKFFGHLTSGPYIKKLFAKNAKSFQ